METESSQSYQITPEMLEQIKTTALLIANTVKQLGKINKDELFIKIFSEPGFPNQPIVGKNNKLDEFNLAIAGLDKNLYKITGDEIIYVNPQS